MDRYLNTGVKEVIREFPTVGEILEEYGIGCVPCAAGTCLLKDVVEIHRLAPDAEAQMLARVARVIDPDRPVDLPAPAPIRRAPRPKRRCASGRSGAAEVRQLSYSPPLQKLVDEHKVIKRWLALLPTIMGGLEGRWGELRPILSQGIEFIRRYADAYHHAKEEEILFAGLDPKLDIIATMRQEHDQARQLVRRLVEGLETSDRRAVAAGLKAYGELLQAHIKKEDEILYPWIDRGLSDTQVGWLFAQFGAVDRQFAQEPARWEAFVHQVEQTLGSGAS